MSQLQKKTNLRQLREHLLCVLCGGYLIDATTIVECLHSFCKTCIVRYLDSSKFCPICDVQVHKTKPLVNIRMDHTLQDIVYKLVPGLFKEEMRRRREFYKENLDDDDNNGPWPEYYIDDDGEVQRERVIFSGDEQISLSLELSTDGKPPKTADKRDNKSSSEMTDCRYLLCPAAVTVSHLKKFIRLKFNLCDRYQIDVYHTDEILKDHYSLMDIAYIYIWRRKGPLRLFYTVYTNPSKKMKRSISATVTSDVEKDASIVEMSHTTNLSEVINHKKDELPERIEISAKNEDSSSKVETQKVNSNLESSATVSSNGADNVESNLESTEKAEKLSEIVPNTSRNNDKIQNNDKPKKKDTISCPSINVPSPHRSFLVGTKTKEKLDKKYKDCVLSRPNDQILSLPVKFPDSKLTAPPAKPSEKSTKPFSAPKPTTLNLDSRNKTEPCRANEITKNVTRATTTNGISSKHSSSRCPVSTDSCAQSDAKKTKLTHDSVKGVVHKNGSEGNINKVPGNPYITKPAVTHVGTTLSSADKTRKLLHIPERPIHAYVPMAHYQGMNGLFHYRAHIADYGNDAPQDLSMKKKNKETTETNSKPSKSVVTTDDKTNKDKNGEVDKYAFTDDDAVPVTGRKLQHVKSEPVALN